MAFNLKSMKNRTHKYYVYTYTYIYHVAIFFRSKQNLS